MEMQQSNTHKKAEHTKSLALKAPAKIKGITPAMHNATPITIALLKVSS